MTCGAIPNYAFFLPIVRGRRRLGVRLLLKALRFNSQTGLILIMISAFDGLSVVDVYGYDFESFCGAGIGLRQVVFDEGS